MAAADGPATRRESARNVASQYASAGKPGSGAWQPGQHPGKRQRVTSEKGGSGGETSEDGTGVPNGPTTPATTNSGGTPAKATRGDSSGSEGGGHLPAPANKKQRAAWSAEAIALGYETGTIKNSAYVLLAQSGVQGMTVATIVDAATKQGLYSWGTCKTPNNSVTAALSQDTTFVRIAPSTYALRSTLKGGQVGPVPQARTSSGSINSGQPAQRSMSGSGLSAGAVAGGRSNLGPKAISSKARKVERQREHAQNAERSRAGGRMAMAGARGPPSDAHVLDGGVFGGVDPFDDGFEALGGMMEGGMHLHGGMHMGAGVVGAADAQRAHAAHQMPAGTSFGGNASKISSTLAMESYRRRMDVCGGTMHGEYEHDRVFQFIPPARPQGFETEEAIAGSCLSWFPVANQPDPPPSKPSPMREPTEGIMRASSWKDEAKSLFGSPDPKDFEEVTGLSRLGSGHLPKWVLESFNSGDVSPGAIAA